MTQDLARDYRAAEAPPILRLLPGEVGESAVRPEPPGREGQLIELLLREVRSLMPALRSGVPDLMDQAVFTLDRTLGAVHETAGLLLGRVALQVCPLDLAALVRSLAVPGRVDVEVPVRTMVHGDERRLADALQALVDTALREALPGSAVRVRIWSGIAGQVEVQIEQPGLVSPARARRLMEPLEEGGSAGLGIHLSRAVALAHGGGVGVDLVEGPDARCVYRLHLPLSGPGTLGA